MESKVIRADNSFINVLGIQSRTLVSCKESAGAFNISELSGVKGAGVPYHVHTREDEIFYVLEGALRMRLGKEEVVATPGTTIIAGRNTPHEFFVDSDWARCLVTITPGHLESMFMELASLSQTADPADIAAICAKFGITFLQTP